MWAGRKSIAMRAPRFPIPASYTTRVWNRGDGIEANRSAIGQGHTKCDVQRKADRGFVLDLQKQFRGFSSEQFEKAMRWSSVTKIKPRPRASGTGVFSLEFIAG